MANGIDVTPGTGSLLSKVATDEVNGMHFQRVRASNGPTRLHDAFETFSSARWTTNGIGSGDIVQIDGNVASASYLVISKNPLVPNTETSIESKALFEMPYRMGIGYHQSQRTIGQTVHVEIVSEDTAGELLASYTPRAISSMSQAASVLTVDTTTAHGLMPGERIAIAGCVDSRFNYPSIVVATIVTTTRFTVAAGAFGPLPSLTAGPVTSGTVHKRAALGYGTNGTSMVFENAVATTASIFARSDGGDVLPSGTVNGAHGVSVGSTASAQLLASIPGAYSFVPTTIFELLMQLELLNWVDVGIDSQSAYNSRIKRTQLVPNPDKKYKLRIRAANSVAMTYPVAKIVSVTKSGTATATVVTDVPHGLTVNDVVGFFGVRDQTNFANASIQTIASIVNSTTFTTVYGSAVTATSYGGAVYRTQGGVGPAAVGASTIAVSTVARASNLLTIFGNTSWTGLTIGDYVNLYGCRDNTTGADLSLDGVYRVRDLSGTFLVLEPIGAAPVTGADFATVNAGGLIIKRTDTRISFVRVMEFERLVTESYSGMGRNSDQGAALPVFVGNSVLATNFSQLSSATPLSIASPGGFAASALGVALGQPSTFADFALAARTGTGSVVAIIDGIGASLSGRINVTAVTGTSPTMDLSLEESYDNGTNWVTIWQAPRIQSSGVINVPHMQIGGRRRWSWVIGGTTPSFTFAIDTMKTNLSAPVIRQFFLRTLDPNTLNAVSATFSLAGVLRADARVLVSTLGSPAPTVALDVSDDGANWIQVGQVAAPAVGLQAIYSANLSAAFGRFRTSAAGTGSALSFCSISGLN